METVQNITQLELPKNIIGNQNKNSIPIGIEVELEKATKINTTNWLHKDDGSLKIQGIEYTTCVYHDYALEVLKELQQKVKNPLITPRCSIHIHVNILDFNLNQLYLLIFIYIIFEDLLYDYSGNRNKNIFCVPVKDHLKNLVYTSFNRLNKFFPKYCGFHIIPEGKYGTVEFRHMKGNLNPEYINNWINILIDLRNYAKDNVETVEQLEEHRKKLFDMNISSEYNKLFEKVFPNTKQLLYNDTFESSIESNILFLKTIYKG